MKENKMKDGITRTISQLEQKQSFLCVLSTLARVTII